MKEFLLVASIFTLSLVIVQILQNVITKSIRISSVIKRYQLRVNLLVIGSIGLMPLVLLLILGDKFVFAEIAKNFLISLLVSITFGLVIEYIRTWLLRGAAKSEERHDESLSAQVTVTREKNWKTFVEQETLRRFGLNSTVGVSFNSLNRLGNQFSELIILEREIDAIEQD